MDDKQRIALIETRTKGNDGLPPQLIRYQLGNHLGSASLELDDNATVISYEEYYPYGSTSYQAVNKDIKAAAKRYRYTGKERDEESGLYYHGARYYAPWLGRWVSCDPAGMADGTNVYAYVSDNPVRLVDHVGTQGQDPTVDPALVESKYLLYMSQASGQGSSALPFTREEGNWLWKHHPEWVQEMQEARAGYIARERASWERKDRQRFAARMETVGKIVETVGTVEMSLLLWSVAGAVAPTLTAAAAGYETGVATTEAVTGQSSGIGIMKNLIAGTFDPGRNFSTKEWVFTGVGAVLGWVGIGFGARATRQATASERAEAIHVAARGPAHFRNKNPTVVATTKEGKTYVVRGPTKSLEPAQRGNLRAGEEIVRMRSELKVPKGERIHPDIRPLIRSFFERTRIDELVAAGQEFCPSCRDIIRAFGGEIVSPNRAKF